MLKGIIVDDESTAREIMLEMCKLPFPRSKSWRLFPNAIEALKYVNHNPVDLIFPGHSYARYDRYRLSFRP